MRIALLSRKEFLKGIQKILIQHFYYFIRKNVRIFNEALSSIIPFSVSYFIIARTRSIYYLCKLFTEIILSELIILSMEDKLRINMQMSMRQIARKETLFKKKEIIFYS